MCKYRFMSKSWTKEEGETGGEGPNVLQFSQSLPITSTQILLSWISATGNSPGWLFKYNLWERRRNPTHICVAVKSSWLRGTVNSMGPGGVTWPKAAGRDLLDGVRVSAGSGLLVPYMDLYNGTSRHSSLGPDKSFSTSQKLCSHEHSARKPQAGNLWLLHCPNESKLRWRPSFS